MKKFLSLVLALIMTMSLVTVSAGAKDFTDDDKVTYDEAVAVMSEVKVLDGYTDGSFKPQGELTRGAASKIICNMILGPTTAAELHADTAPYKDVPVDHTFAGYIAYCAKEGIISGYADGTFRPAAPLTGYAFMKMLLGALGYDQDVEGFTGANWSINVAKRALGIGLNKGLMTEFSGIKSVTREEAALYAFNTLKATMVDYEAKTTVSVGGANVVVAGSTAKEVEWIGYNNADGNVKNDDLVQFAEKYFSKLKAEPDSDAFGRPATKWSYNKTDIGSFVNWSLKVEQYTKKVKGGDVYSDIGSTAAKYDFVYFVDGKQDKDVKVAADLKIEKKGDKTMGDSALGALTEVFVDDDAEVTYVVIVNTYLGEMISDYNEKTELSKVNIYVGADTDKKTEKILTKTVKLENVANVADFEDDDMVLVTMADGVVMSLAAPKVVEEVEISSFSTNDDTDVDTGTKLDSIVAAGEKYDAAVMAFYDAEVLVNYTETILDDNTFNVYLDPYGNVIGIEIVDASAQYVFVVGFDKNTSALSKAADKASIIMTDGTQAVVEVDVDDVKGILNADDPTVNTWFKYEMDGETYVLTAKADQIQTTYDEINSSNTTLPYTYTDKDNNTKTVYKFGNAASAYITVDTDDIEWNPTARIIDEVQTVVTGIKNADIIPLTEKQADGTLTDIVVEYGAEGTQNAPAATGNVFALFNNSGYITYAIVIGEDASSTNNLVYITSTNVVNKTYVDSTTGYVYTYKAIIEGEETTVQVKADAAKGIASNGLYTFTYDANGYAKKVELVADVNSTQPLNTAYFKANGKAALYDDTLVLTAEGATLYFADSYSNAHYVILDEDCEFWVKNTDKKDGGNDAWTEYKDVEAALSELGTTATIDGGHIAIIADKDTGYAKYVIMYDTDYDVIGDTPVAPPAKSTDAVVVGDITYGSSTTFNYYVEAGKKTLTPEDIYALLAADGCTNIVRDGATGKWSFDKGISKYTNVDVTPTQVYLVTFKLEENLAAWASFDLEKWTDMDEISVYKTETEMETGFIVPVFNTYWMAFQKDILAGGEGVNSWLCYDATAEAYVDSTGVQWPDAKADSVVTLFFTANAPATT